MIMMIMSRRQRKAEQHLSQLLELLQQQNQKQQQIKKTNYTEINIPVSNIHNITKTNTIHISCLLEIEIAIHYYYL